MLTITPWPPFSSLLAGEGRHRSCGLAHAKRALYHLSYFPCAFRESNPGQSVGNGLLYHSTKGARYRPEPGAPEWKSEPPTIFDESTGNRALTASATNWSADHYTMLSGVGRNRTPGLMCAKHAFCP